MSQSPGGSRENSGPLTPGAGQDAGSPSGGCASTGTEGVGSIPPESNRYVVFDEELGSGGFGSVYKGFDHVTGAHVAVKEAHVGHRSKKDATAVLKMLQEEFALLISLQHKNIVRVHNYRITQGGTAQIFMEWMPSGSVADIIQMTRFRLHELVVRRYAKSVLQGLVYLHGQGVLHRDIKPANMLVSSDGEVKLSDFGTSRQKVHDATHGGGNGAQSTTGGLIGTTRFMAPESIKAQKYSQGSDMWAFGCSLVAMLGGALPWVEAIPRSEGDNITIIFHIGTAQPPNHHPKIPEHCSPFLVELMKKCFDPDYTARPSAEQLLQSPYFTLDESTLLDVESTEAFQAKACEVMNSHRAQTASAENRIGQQYAGGTPTPASVGVPKQRSKEQPPEVSEIYLWDSVDHPTGAPIDSVMLQGMTGPSEAAGSPSPATMITEPKTTQGRWMEPTISSSASPPPRAGTSSSAAMTQPVDPRTKPHNLPRVLPANTAWAYRKDSGTYHQFDAVDSKNLTLNYNNQGGAGTYTLHMSRHSDKRVTSYKIDFDKMEQINITTNFKRKLKVLTQTFK